MNNIRLHPQYNFYNNKGKKKSLPISINSNMQPCQFLFSKPTSKVATSYINIGQKIHTKNHKKNKSNTSNNILKNQNFINNNRSQITYNSIINTNQNITLITNYNKKKRENSISISNRDTYYHSRKKTPIYYKKSSYNSIMNSNNISKKNLNKNSCLIASRQIKKQTIKNFKFKNNSTYSEIINNIKKFNNEKDDKPFKTLNENKNNFKKSNDNNMIKNKRMLSHENIKINKPIENENKIKEISKKGSNDKILNHKHSISKDNGNIILKKNKSFQYNLGNDKINIIYQKKNLVPRADVKIDLYKILKDIKVSNKHNNEYNKKSNNKQTNKENINYVQIENDNNEFNLLKKITLSEPNTTKTIIKIKEEVKITKNNKEINNELFNNYNLLDLPSDYDDKFDDLNSVVRKIHFNTILINKENLFSHNNKIYNNYKQTFNNDFEKNNLIIHNLKNINLSSDKNKKTERKNNNNLSFSTQSGSSYKKAFQNHNSLISPISSKFNLNI